MSEVPHAPARGRHLWRDLLLSLAAGGLATLLAALVEFHEKLFAYTRRWEPLQLDELPVGIFVFALCLTGFYARRQAELRRVLRDNRRLAQRTLDVQEAERKHLARELHDELGQYLNAIQLDCQAIVDGDGEPPQVIARRIGGNADHVYGVVGGMINRLRPAGLDELGLAAALESCIAGWQASQPVMRFGLQLTGDLEDLGERVNLAIYRIVQEGLTNAVRHAHAEAVHVALARERAPDGRERVRLTVRDEGTGMTVGAEHPQGRGLAGMRERVVMLGGDFELLSRAGHGVTIRAVFPLPAVEA